MKSGCLVTGGAGFIGCATASSLVEQFGDVLVVDNLHPQVHKVRTRPAALDERVALQVADVCDPATWSSVLRNFEPRAILHLAAETGTGQSLTESTRHAMVNVVGLTTMLDALSASKAFPRHIVLTSSRAVYGEGAWHDPASGTVRYPGQRTAAMLSSGIWDFPGLTALPFVAGETNPQPTSVYGATKFAQEHILQSWGLAFGVDVSVLRLQNVYGPGQSLSNPYTGVMTLFSQIARQRQQIPLYEDGRMLRDFVYIDDVRQAIDGAFRAPPAKGLRTVDIGSGQACTIAQAASIIANNYGAPEPVVGGKFRHGDVRHASCRIEAAQRDFGYEPATYPQTGLVRLCQALDAELGRAK